MNRHVLVISFISLLPTLPFAGPPPGALLRVPELEPARLDLFPTCALRPRPDVNSATMPPGFRLGGILHPVVFIRRPESPRFHRLRLTASCPRPFGSIGSARIVCRGSRTATSAAPPRAAPAFVNAFTLLPHGRRPLGFGAIFGGAAGGGLRPSGVGARFGGAASKFKLRAIHHGGCLCRQRYSLFRLLPITCTFGACFVSFCMTISATCATFNATSTAIRSAIRGRGRGLRGCGRRGRRR